MADPSRRYVFYPLERRGVLFGLQAGQVATIVAGLVGAFAAGHAIRGVLGSMVAMAIVAGSAAGAVWPKAGRYLIQWVPVGGAWLARRSAGPARSREPLAGTVAAPDRTRAHESGTIFVSGSIVRVYDRKLARRRKSSPILDAPNGRRAHERGLGPPGIELVDSRAEPGQA